MDVKSLNSCSSSDFVGSPFSFLQGIFKSGSLNRNANEDALEAVKLDPAVLEAQVTLHGKDKATYANFNLIPDVIIENKKEKVRPQPPPSPVPQPSQCPNGFEDMMSQHEKALLSLTPHQLELLMKYAEVLRRQRMITQKYLECAFCKNNGKPSFWYTSHTLRDFRGRVRCPVLRRFHCPRCGATGDQAHTIKYCRDLLTDTRSCSSRKSSL